MHLSDADIESIEGAFWAPDLQVFRVLLEATGERLSGDLAEFGVLHGRSAVLIGDHCGTGEQFTVVDLFEDPAEDADNRQENEYYLGITQTAFEINYRRFHPTLPTVVRGHSHTIADHARHGTHRFVHVDASHLYEHVARDIEVAHQLLQPDGVLALDDYRSEHTPGVAAAAWQAVQGSGLKPFVLTSQKMYATWGDPAPWTSAVLGWAGSTQDVIVDRQRVNGLEMVRLELPAVAGASPHRYKRYVPEILWPAAKHVRELASKAGATVRGSTR